MFAPNELLHNKERFINLINSIDREGAEKDRLIRQLEKSDFFQAPASTIYHNAVEGGLCAHSLNVYDYLVKLMKMKYPIITKEIVNEQGIIQYNENHEPLTEEVDTCPYSDDTIKIVSLLHDMSKMNFYERYLKNQKTYSPNGSKKEQNEAGEWVKFDWISVPGYKIKEAEDRFLFGNHEMTSLYMIEQFIPLSAEESTAIIHHHMGMSKDCAQDEIGAIMVKYPLAMLLHMADMLAAYSIEELNH